MINSSIEGERRAGFARFADSEILKFRRYRQRRVKIYEMASVAKNAIKNGYSNRRVSRDRNDRLRHAKSLRERESD